MKGIFLAAVSLALLAAAAHADDSVPAQPASASDLGLDPSMEVLGTYKISGITTVDHGERFDACVAHRDRHGIETIPDRRCGQGVWVIRTDKQLALLESQLSGGPRPDLPDSTEPQAVEAAVFYGDSCDLSMPLADAKTSLLAPSSKFCHALRTRTTPGFTAYSFKESAVPAGQRAARGAYSAPALALGVGVGSSSEYSVLVPNGERSPSKLTVTETVTGLVQIVFIPIPTHWQSTLTLTYEGP